MTKSRRPLVFALVLAVIVALLLWWRGRDDHGGSRAGEIASANDATKPRRDANPIGAEAEQDARSSMLPWNRPGTSISGHVTDEQGKPVGNADVCAVLVAPEIPTALTREPKCSKSGGDGRYLIAELPPIEIAIAASAPTFIPGSYDPPGNRDFVRLHEGQAAKDIDVVLRGGGVLVHGVVKDIAGGVIEGAHVQARHGWGWRTARGMSFTKSDAQGAFSVWAEPGDLNLEAEAEGYAKGSKSGTAPGFTFEILMTPESVLSGRVVSAKDGKPVADAQVAIEQWFWSEHSTYTDADGFFRLDRLEPGRYKPIAKTAEGYGQIAESIRLGLGQAVDGIEIQLHPMAAVRGHVMIAGETPKPCDRGSVSLTGKVSQHRARDEPDGEGAIEVSALPPDTYTVEVYCTGFVAEAKYPDIVVGEVTGEEQAWTVKPGLAVRGVVVDQAGKPIPRAQVGARSVGTAARGQQTSAWGERTDEAGAFELNGMIAGSYELRVDHDDFVSPEEPPKLTLTDGEKPAEQKLVLEAGGTVKGQVVDANHQPVSGATVRAVGKQWGGGDATTADDGSFEMKAVRPGELRVVAQRGWSNEMRAPGTTDDDVQGERVQVVAGEVATVELVVEEQFGKITGKVVDADGAPVDDAFVHTTRESDSAAANEKGSRANVRWGQWNRTPSLTEQDGSFALDELEVGKHTVMAMRKGGGEGLVEHVETGTTGVVIKLAEGGTISGKVALSSGGTPERFAINVEERSQGVWRNEDFFETGGVWSIADLPAGKYIVGVSAAEGSSDTEIELAAGAEKTGITLTLTPKVDVTGTIVDLDTGAPVPGMKVSVQSKKGGGGIFFSSSGGDMEDVSDESGKFTVRAAPAGAVRVSVMPRNFFGSDQEQYGWSNISTNIPTDQATHALAPIRVAKSRTKRSERGGDLGITLKEGDPEAEDEDVPLQIAVIRPGSPASQSELKIGDIIVEVDGKDVTGANKYLYHSLTHVKEGDEVSLSVQGGGSVTLVAGKPI
jgi:Carboxypeptidase regulatory-like domain/PDZ domain